MNINDLAQLVSNTYHELPLTEFPNCCVICKFSYFQDCNLICSVLEKIGAEVVVVKPSSVCKVFRPKIIEQENNG